MMKCLLLSILLVGVLGVDEERVPNDIIGVIKKMQSQMDIMEKKVGHFVHSGMPQEVKPKSRIKITC